MAIDPLTPERRREQTRQYLLQAAARVFAEHGFHGATLDEVAAAAGFSKGAVYSNFKNKEDLFLALLEANDAQEMADLRATLNASDVPPEARLSDFVALISSSPGHMPNDWGALYLEFCLYATRNPAARERLAAWGDVLIRTISDMVEEGRARQGIVTTEPAERAARVVVALFRGIGLMRVLEPDAVDEALLEYAVSFVARALGTTG